MSLAVVAGMKKTNDHAEPTNYFFINDQLKRNAYTDTLFEVLLQFRLENNNIRPSLEQIFSFMMKHCNVISV